jgi:hypothetical protein
MSFLRRGHGSFGVDRQDRPDQRCPQLPGRLLRGLGQDQGLHPTRVIGAEDAGFV